MRSVGGASLTSAMGGRRRSGRVHAGAEPSGLPLRPRDPVPRHWFPSGECAGARQGRPDCECLTPGLGAPQACRRRAPRTAHNAHGRARVPMYTHRLSHTCTHRPTYTARSHAPPHRRTPACSPAHTCTHAHLSICSHAPAHVSDTHLHAHVLTRAHRPMYTACSGAPTHTSDTHLLTHTLNILTRTDVWNAHALTHTHTNLNSRQHTHALVLTCTHPWVLSCTHVHARRPSAARLAPGAGGQQRVPLCAVSPGP